MRFLFFLPSIDFQYMGGKFYENVVHMQKKMTGNMAMKSLGLSTLDNIGRLVVSRDNRRVSLSAAMCCAR